MTISQQIKEAQEILNNLKSKITSRTFPNKLTVKIGEKGTLNIYGLARFPVCLYLSQAVKLSALFESPEFKQFVMENMDKLPTEKAKPE